MTWVNDGNVALLTDLYEITMSASYFGNGMNDRTTFDLFVRELPPQRNFLVAAGLEGALDYLEALKFQRESIDYLRSLGMFSEDFLSYLATFRFSGDVRAIPEGEIVFAGEPLMRVSAPLIEAQLLETFLINAITYQTMVASKAARVAIVCGDREFVDFSPRRDHAADAALRAARAAYIGGASGTSNVLAGQVYGLPVSGTMAHSYVMAFEDEATAFRSFMRDFPDGAVVIIDTFDVEEGARRAVRIAAELAPEGVRLGGVRIDSGDFEELTRSVRKILDEAGMEHVRIILSGDLEEYRIKELLDADVPVDAFGVGSQLGTSADAPTLGGVYKLVADRHGPKIKLSTKKMTRPGCKQVFRIEQDGLYAGDVIALESETVAGRPLLQQVMEDGKRATGNEPLSVLQRRCRKGLEKLPPSLRSLKQDHSYSVVDSPGLAELIAKMRRQEH